MRRHIDEDINDYAVKLTAHRGLLKNLQVKLIDGYQGRDSNSGAVSSKRLNSKSHNFFDFFLEKAKKDDLFCKALTGSAARNEVDILRKFRIMSPECIIKKQYVFVAV